jgi:hypothetical protein
MLMRDRGGLDLEADDARGAGRRVLVVEHREAEVVVQEVALTLLEADREAALVGARAGRAAARGARHAHRQVVQHHIHAILVRDPRLERHALLVREAHAAERRAGDVLAEARGEGRGLDAVAAEDLAEVLARALDDGRAAVWQRVVLKGQVLGGGELVDLDRDWVALLFVEVEVEEWWLERLRFGAIECSGGGRAAGLGGEFRARLGKVLRRDAGQVEGLRRGGQQRERGERAEGGHV